MSDLLAVSSPPPSLDNSATSGNKTRSIFLINLNDSSRGRRRRTRKLVDRRDGLDNLSRSCCGGEEEEKREKRKKVEEEICEYIKKKKKNSITNTK